MIIQYTSIQKSICFFRINNEGDLMYLFKRIKYIPNLSQLHLSIIICLEMKELSKNLKYSQRLIALCLFGIF